jgi:hypothetical protein
MGGRPRIPCLRAGIAGGATFPSPHPIEYPCESAARAAHPDNGLRTSDSGLEYVIPARLTLRNFLCYRGECPPLELEYVRVACLTGDNGNGKSALLDAMTWALWGKARGRSDGDLVTPSTAAPAAGDRATAARSSRRWWAIPPVTSPAAR